MKRHPLVLATLLASVSPGLSQSSAVPAPETEQSTQLEQSGLVPPTVTSRGYTATELDVMVSALLGEGVYNSAEEDGRIVGVIEDMVISSGTGISAVVVRIADFEGISGKDVAVDFAALAREQVSDGAYRWVLLTPADALAAAPDFVWPGTSGPQERNADAEQVDEGADRPDRAGLTPLDPSALQPDQLRGIGVFDIEGGQIGTIGDVLSNPEGGIDALVVDVGGFLGIGAKPVAVGYDNLQFSADDNGNRYLFLNATRDQLETQPAYDPATYQVDRASQRMMIEP